jgi:hypothetical protein
MTDIATRGGAFLDAQMAIRVIAAWRRGTKTTAEIARDNDAPEDAIWRLIQAERDMRLGYVAR